MFYSQNSKSIRNRSKAEKLFETCSNNLNGNGWSRMLFQLLQCKYTTLKPAPTSVIKSKYSHCKNFASFCLFHHLCRQSGCYFQSFISNFKFHCLPPPLPPAITKLGTSNMNKFQTTYTFES